MTPFVISGGEKAGAEKTIQDYMLARELAIGILGDKEAGIKTGLIDVSEKVRKKISLTPAGKADLQKRLKEGAGIEDSMDVWRRLVEQALSVELCYNENGVKKDYEIAGDEIVIIDKTNGKLTPGVRWSMGLHTAIEAKHAKEGVQVRAEQATINTMTLGTFLPTKTLSKILQVPAELWTKNLY